MFKLKCSKTILIYAFSLLVSAHADAHTSCKAYYQGTASNTTASERAGQVFQRVATEIQTGRVHSAVISELILDQTNQVMDEVNQLVQTIIMPDTNKESKNYDDLAAGNIGISEKIDRIKNNGTRFDKSFLPYIKREIAKDTAIAIRETRQLQIKVAKYLEPMKIEIRDLSELKISIEDIKTRVDQEFEYVRLVLERLKIVSAPDLISILQAKLEMLSSAQFLLQVKIEILNQRIIAYHGIAEESRLLSQVGIHSVIDSMPNLMSAVNPLLGTDFNVQVARSSLDLETARQKEDRFRKQMGLPDEQNNDGSINILIQTVRLTTSAGAKTSLIQNFVTQNAQQLGIYNLIDLLQVNPDPESRGRIAKLVFSSLSDRTTVGAVLDLIKMNLRVNDKEFILVSYANSNRTVLKNSELEVLASHCLTGEARATILNRK